MRSPILILALVLGAGCATDVTNVTETLLTYALGRGVEFFDMPAVRQIMRESESADYRWSSLIMGIVRSAPFQMRRSES